MSETAIKRAEVIKTHILNSLSKKPFLSAPDLDYSKEGKALAKKFNVPKNYPLINKVLKKLLEEGVISSRKREGKGKTREFALISDYVAPEKPEIEEEVEPELEEEDFTTDEELEEDLEVEDVEEITPENDLEAQAEYKDEYNKNAITTRGHPSKKYLQWYGKQ